MGPSLFFSAGEVSGDLYGAGLLAALTERCPEVRAYGLGGPWMRKQGLRTLADVRSLAAVGLSENLASLPMFWGLKQRLRTWLRQVRPQAVILIDFQGLNLQLASVAQGLNIPVIYFVAPQDWLWGFDSGLRRILRDVDLILAIFGPEAEFYRTAGARVIRVGHPLLQLLPNLSQAEARSRLGIPLGAPVICWMPGSRQLEVRRLLPLMAQIQARMPQDCLHLMPMAADFLITKGQTWARQLDVEERYLAMLAADVVAGASGNMVLEAALLARPVLAMYRVSPLTYEVARRLVRLPWITLPNLLLQRPLVPEFVQHLDPEPIARTLQQLMIDPSRWEQAATELRHMLGPTEANQRAAASILKLLHGS